ncbi:hypothetical protein [Runella sp.]|uniref:hypothetical protein n=1 Tax=Runella sp. TaxID=1960881 RepID=UPI003D0BFCC1
MNFITNKKLFVFSLALVMYFLFLYLNADAFHLEYTFIGVIQEVLTLPLLVMLLLLLGLSLKRTISERFSFINYSFWSLLLLMVCVTFTVGSFF